ncbi:hypothetical protein HNV11_21900 [Spirosoma taeanense]|uniref:Outer membrane protein beta-barrel domain-containing protein n=2 Tax=Spirosoma taeanense TaxID=2735870 RepID=A0A6M5YGI2_9BACT|nr:hypothetical protein HNV11_21900 [Spirosoma taeanense]
MVISLIAAYEVQAAPVHSTDSLVIRFANRTRLVIYAPDKAGIQALSNYDLNKIVREMSMQLDSVPGGQHAISRDGGRYLKDTVLVVTKKKDGITIVINGADKTKVDSTKKQSSDSNNDRDYQRAKRQKKDNGHNIDYSISIGLNNFIQRGQLPAYPEDSYDLRPIGSRYVALAIGAMPTIIRGRYASLKLYYGAEVAWNNFMFDGNNIAEQTPAGIAFPDAGRDLQKSKLTICTIGIPVVPRITFYNSDGRKICHLGVGGYVNYRLDSYRKIKEADGNRDRRHFNFDLNDYRYGLMAHLGIKSANFFVKYDLSPLFEPGKGPDVRTVSFGIGF